MKQFLSTTWSNIPNRWRALGAAVLLSLLLISIFAIREWRNGLRYERERSTIDTNLKAAEDRATKAEGGIEIIRAENGVLRQERDDATNARIQADKELAEARANTQVYRARYESGRKPFVPRAPGVAVSDAELRADAAKYGIALDRKPTP